MLVEDGGVAIDALNGFPGVYTKYSNGTLGAEGIIKLMAGESNRRAKFVSTATYIDATGTEHQFHRRGGDFLIADKVSPVDSPLAWSVMWKIIDITPILPPKKRLKIGTFKVGLNRQNLGKRLFQIVFQNAANMNVDEIYGTIFDSDTNGWQKQALVKLVLDLGFYRWGVKSTGETVYVRDMTKSI